MKKVKMIFLGLILGLLVGCSTSAVAEQTRPLKIWFENENGMMQTYNIVDEKTGVNYIVVAGEKYSNPFGTAITPRLNADGSLYITK